MSDAAAHAPAHGGSASSKTWTAVGATLSIMLGVVVLLWIIGALLNPAASGIEQIVTGLKAVNRALFGFKYESNLFLITVIQVAVLPVLLFLLIKYWALK
jgi:hypothetical protein